MSKKSVKEIHRAKDRVKAVLTGDPRLVGVGIGIGADGEDGLAVVVYGSFDVLPEAALQAAEPAQLLLVHAGEPKPQRTFRPSGPSRVA